MTERQYFKKPLKKNEKPKGNENTLKRFYKAEINKLVKRIKQLKRENRHLRTIIEKNFDRLEELTHEMSLEELMETDDHGEEETN